jgi:hypothetical protein
MIASYRDAVLYGSGNLPMLLKNKHVYYDAIERGIADICKSITGKSMSYRTVLKHIKDPDMPICIYAYRKLDRRNVKWIPRRYFYDEAFRNALELDPSDLKYLPSKLWNTAVTASWWHSDLPRDIEYAVLIYGRMAVNDTTKHTYDILIRHFTYIFYVSRTYNTLYATKAQVMRVIDTDCRTDLYDMLPIRYKHDDDIIRRIIIKCGYPISYLPKALVIQYKSLCEATYLTPETYLIMPKKYMKKHPKYRVKLPFIHQIMNASPLYRTVKMLYADRKYDMKIWIS